MAAKKKIATAIAKRTPRFPHAARKKRMPQLYATRPKRKIKMFSRKTAPGVLIIFSLLFFPLFAQALEFEQGFHRQKVRGDIGGDLERFLLHFQKLLPFFRSHLLPSLQGGFFLGGFHLLVSPYFSLGPTRPFPAGNFRGRILPRLCSTNSRGSCTYRSSHVWAWLRKCCFHEAQAPPRNRGT